MRKHLKQMKASFAEKPEPICKILFRAEKNLRCENKVHIQSTKITGVKPKAALGCEEI